MAGFSGVVYGSNALAYSTHIQVMKKITFCEYGTRSLTHTHAQRERETPLANITQAQKNLHERCYFATPSVSKKKVLLHGQ